MHKTLAAACAALFFLGAAGAASAACSYDHEKPKASSSKDQQTS